MGDQNLILDRITGFTEVKIVITSVYPNIFSFNVFMVDMKFSKFKIENYEQLTQLWKDAGLPYKPKGRDRKEELVKQIQKPGNFYLSVFVKKRMIGFIMASHNRRKGWINRLVVHPDFQKKGLALKLIRKAEEYFMKEGVDIFACLIEDWNEPSRKLFKKAGYIYHPEVLYFTRRINPDV